MGAKATSFSCACVHRHLTSLLLSFQNNVVQPNLAIPSFVLFSVTIPYHVNLKCERKETTNFNPYTLIIPPSPCPNTTRHYPTIKIDKTLKSCQLLV